MCGMTTKLSANWVLTLTSGRLRVKVAATLGGHHHHHLWLAEVGIIAFTVLRWSCQHCLHHGIGHRHCNDDVFVVFAVSM